MEKDKGCKMVPLGKDSQVKIMESEVPKKNLSIEERVSMLETKVADLRTLVTTLLKLTKNNQDSEDQEKQQDTVVGKNDVVGNNTRLNKDMIPINSILTGIVNGVPHVLYVHRNSYTVGNKGYETLSGAAKAVTGKRRNGWEFWRTPDGTKIGDTIIAPIYDNS